MTPEKWELEWLFNDQLHREYLYQKVSKSDNPF